MKDLCLANHDFLYELVDGENTRQLMKWGIQDRSPFEWMVYLTEEVGELAEAISEHAYRHAPPDGVVTEAIQVATLALKIAEMYSEEFVELTMQPPPEEDQNADHRA
ncbi:MAG: hypothetical protein PHV00_06105 [Syntrophales bacterium]|jgi:NTP pyrophosphatase (non-canonical NTP hydrolase)|nr:hypothetical protein [Syntrophales bacterium]